MVDRLQLKVPPALVGALIAFLQVGISRWVPALHVDIKSQSSLALFIAAVGLGIAIAGVVAFRKRSTTVNPHSPGKTSALVTSGIYGLTRNPMYLGMMIVLVGWSIHLGNVGATLTVVPFVAYITRFQIKPEEAILLHLFPHAFPDYCLRVRRWL